MSDFNAQQAEYEAKYKSFEPIQLTKEFHAIRANHTKENMIDDLLKMTALTKVMEEKGVAVPGQNKANNTQANNKGAYQPQRSYGQLGNSHASEGGPAWGKVVLGGIILMVGIGLTASGGGIFYGAILVGGFMLIGGLMGN